MRRLAAAAVGVLLAVLPSYASVFCRSKGDFESGDPVLHRSRGPGRVVCQSKYSSDVIGICQGRGSGHNNYGNCVQAGRPTFCSEDALWFVHCENTRRFTIPGGRQEQAHMQQSVAAVPVRQSPLSTPYFRDGHICGCSWSAQQGCQVSGEQVVASLSDEQQTKDWCDGYSSEECRIGTHVSQIVASFRHCFGLSAMRCGADPACQWGAQRVGHCGIDEEHFMVKAVGPENQNHPLVRMIMYHDHCNQLSEERCDADLLCESQGLAGPRTCDVKPSLVAKIIMTNPRLVLEWEETSLMAMCHAQSVHAKLGDAAPSLRNCGGPCSLTPAGACVVDHAKMPKTPELQQIIDGLCDSEYRMSKHDCPSPCVFARSGSRMICRGPPVSGSMLRVEDTSPDKNLIAVLVFVTSAMMPYEQQCKHLPEMQCRDAQPVCKEKASAWAKAHLKTPSKVALPTLGFKGVLHEAAQAVANGKGREFMEEFISNNPDAVHELTGKLADRLKTLMQPVTTPEPVAATAVPARTDEAPHTQAFSQHGGHPQVSKNTVTKQTQDKVSQLVPDGLGDKLASPWIVAVCAALVAAICAGVALGVLCSSRLLRGESRELRGALLATDQDMSTLSGGDPGYDCEGR